MCVLINVTISEVFGGSVREPKESERERERRCIPLNRVVWYTSHVIELVASRQHNDICAMFFFVTQRTQTTGNRIE